MVPVSMETFMNEKRPRNPGDGVNEELLRRPNSLTGDGVYKLECQHHHHQHYQCYFRHIRELEYIT